MRTPAFVLVVSGLLIVGCAALYPEGAYVAVQPRTPPQRIRTNFSESLICMDREFIKAGLGIQGTTGSIYVTSPGVVDKTSKDIQGQGLGGDNREVMMGIIAIMAKGTEGVVFIADDPYATDTQKRPPDYIAPHYIIPGAITIRDDNVTAHSWAASIGYTAADFGFAKDQLVSVLGVDFVVIHARTRRVISGINSSNRIAVARRGTAIDAGGVIPKTKTGVFFNVSWDTNEGLYAALRALIQLGLIEVIGQLAKVPYWQCLQSEQTNPEFIAKTSKEFEGMTEQERITFVQQRLAQLNYYNGAITGIQDRATHDAIARYQKSAGLIATGRINLELHQHLLGQNVGEQDIPTPAKTESAPPPLGAPPDDTPLVITLTTPRGKRPAYGHNEELSLVVEVSRDAFLYCFYQDGYKRISRLYPNRFQNKENAYVRAHQSVTIPDGPNFKILLDVPNTTEAVLCLASPEDIEFWLPYHLRADLQALRVRSLDEISKVARQKRPSRLAEAYLHVHVGGRVTMAQTPNDTRPPDERRSPTEIVRVGGEPMHPQLLPTTTSLVERLVFVGR